MRRASGVVLVMVLWLLILLSMIALHLVQISRSEAQLAANMVAAARARHAADAGVRWALWNLSIPLNQRWLADGEPHHLQLGEVKLQVALFDENGKVDLNYAGASSLTGLFDAIGVAPEQSRSLVDAILDWRDPDNLQRLHGAEDDDYLAAGLDYVPRNAPFRQIAELKRVIGMTEAIYQQLRPALTIYSGRSVINPQVAPRLVLLTQPAISEAVVEQYIEARRRHHREGRPLPQPPPLPSHFVTSGLNSVYYTVHTTAFIPGRASVDKQWVIRNLGVGRRDRFQIIDPGE